MVASSARRNRVTYLFATHKPFAMRWAHGAGETGPRGNPASKAAYARLPRRKGARKRA